MYTVYSMQERPNLSESVAETLRERIVDGRLAAGSRINEVHLAADLGVSRTPLREALGRLVAEGALTVQPRFGFYVAPLSIEELEQIYPMRGILDPEALRLAGLPTEERLRELAAINDELRKATNPADVLRLDDKFHLELIAFCPNRVLVRLIEQFIRRTRRYELALMRDQENVENSAGEHERVLAKLRKRDLRGACVALRKNMEIGMEPLVAWLRARDTKEEATA